MPLALRLNEGLGVDEAVVLCMSADPEPVNASLSWEPKCTVVQTNPRAVQLATTQQFELQRGVAWIRLEKNEVLVCKRPYFSG